MRKYLKLGLIAVGAAGALGAAVYFVPDRIDVEAYKPALIEAVREATGRELVIDGRMRLRLFPVPGIGVGRVRFANSAAAGPGPRLIDVRWISVRPSWSGLLSGRVEIGRLALFRPTIELETDASGRSNWDFALPGRMPGESNAGMRVPIGKLEIIKGTVRYTDRRTSQTIVAEELEATATAGTLSGPMTLAGTAKVNGLPVEVVLDVGPPTPQGNNTTLKVQVLSGKFDFKGSVSKLAPDATLKGHLKAETGLLTDFIAELMRVSGGLLPDVGASVSGRFTFDGGIELSPQLLALENFTMRMGRERASGTLAITPGPVPAIKGHLRLGTVDLEKWQAASADPRFLALFAPRLPSPAPGAAGSALSPSGPRKQAAKPPPGKMAAPADVDLSLQIDVRRMLYRKEAIRDVSLTLDMHNGALALPKLHARLPGDMILDVAADGNFSLSGTRLRDTLVWFGLDAGGLAKDKLQTLKFAGRMKLVDGHAHLADATIAIDDLRGKGYGDFSLSVPIVSQIHVEFDKLDLDAYMPTPIDFGNVTKVSAPAGGGGAIAGGGVATSLPPPGTAAAPAAPSAPLAFGLKAKIAKVVFRRETIAGIEIDGAVQGNRLKLANLQIGSLVGAKLVLRGTVDDYGTLPNVNLAFTANAPDADRLLDYLGLPRFANGKIGAATASGNFAGTPAAMNLSNVAIDFLGVSSRASGRLALTEAVDFDFPTFSLHVQELNRLIALSGGQTGSSLGALALTGKIKGSSRRAVFSGDVDALGLKMTGSLDGTFGPRPRIAATVNVPGTLDLDRLMGSPAAAARASAPAPSTVPAPAPSGQPTPQVVALRSAEPPPRRPIEAAPFDLSALRVFDAGLSIRTGAVVLASQKIDRAELEASLTRGVLKIAKLSGQVFGGGVNIGGTVDASGKSLSIDLSGDAMGLALGPLLRSTTGSSNFGDDHLTVTLEGKIDASGIRLTGKGSSPAELRESLSGVVTVGGHLQPTVVKGSPGFAKFATGLGSIFSEEMAFASMMLKSFIDRQSRIAGRVQLQGGHVVTENHTVQGHDAAAVISSRTSLPASTTDTTVRFSGGSGNFLVTLKGPLDAPTFTAGRPPRSR